MIEKTNKELFFFLLDKRALFFSCYSLMEKTEVSALLVRALSNNDYDAFTPKLIELCGILYKEFNFQCRKTIFDIVINMLTLHRNANDVVAFSNFLWINHHVFDTDNISRAMQVVDQLLLNAENELKDTLFHVVDSFKNINEGIVRHKGAKICFVIPEYLSGLSFLQPPIGFLRAISFLSSHGYVSDIIDNRAKHLQIEELVAMLGEYEVIVISTTPIDQVQNYFVDYRYVIAAQTIKGIRDAYREKTIVVCGSHGTVRPDLLERICHIDYIIRGEYDIVIKDVMDVVCGKRQRKELKNVVYYNGQTYFECHDDATLHPDLDDEIYPDYDAINLADYYGNEHFHGVNVKKRGWSIVQTSRGCPYHCSFCYNFYGDNVRRYSLNHIVSELKDLIHRGVGAIFFIDQTFTQNRSFTLALCREILVQGIKIEWACQTRIDLLDEELLSAMHSAGCNAIWLGVESVNDNVLLMNRKGISRKQIEEKVFLLKKHNVDFKVFFMLGMMGDTDETIDEMVDFIINNKLSCTKSLMVCTPRYGTEMYEIAQREYDGVNNDFLSLNQLRGRVRNSLSPGRIDRAITRINEYLSQVQH